MGYIFNTGSVFLNPVFSEVDVVGKQLSKMLPKIEKILRFYFALIYKHVMTHVYNYLYGVEFTWVKKIQYKIDYNQ